MKDPVVIPTRIRIESVDPEVAVILRDWTPARRIKAAFETTAFVRRVVRSGLRSLHPDWPEHRIEAEVAARFLGGGR